MNAEALALLARVEALRKTGLTQQEIALRLGVGRSTVGNLLRLVGLPDDAKDALQAGKISQGHARAILAQAPPHRAWALHKITSEGLSVRAAEALVRGRRGAAAASQNAETEQLERQISRRVGARVRISHPGRGRLEFHYNSPEELSGLLERLGLLDEEEF